MTVDEATSYALRASESDRYVYYVIKVRGGYDFKQKGFLTPTFAKVVRFVSGGHVEKITKDGR